jgi:hypothetical protein
MTVGSAMSVIDIWTYLCPARCLAFKQVDSVSSTSRYRAGTHLPNPRHRKPKCSGTSRFVVCICGHSLLLNHRTLFLHLRWLSRICEQTFTADTHHCARCQPSLRRGYRYRGLKKSILGAGSARHHRGLFGRIEGVVRHYDNHCLSGVLAGICAEMAKVEREGGCGSCVRILNLKIPTTSPLCS